MALLNTLRTKRSLAILIIVLIAGLLRAWAVWQLPIDFDEPVYLKAGQDYANLIKAGDWNGVIDYSENREHPPLIKLIYSLPEVVSRYPLPPATILYTDRAISAVFGSLAVLLLGLINPLAGGLMAINTLTIKYTSQAYLEALPALSSLAAVGALVKSKKPYDKWYWLSAIALGVTAAGKFSYAPILVVILYLAIWPKKMRLQNIGIYLLTALGVFFLLDPTLWHDPVGRLLGALSFHQQYAQSSQVQQANYPWYQPVLWIMQSVPWHPDVLFFGLDEVTFFFGVPGFYWEWRERRWTAVWFISSMVFLLLWPTKWPQYTILLIPPLCLSASAMLVRVVKKVRELDLYWDWIKMMFVRPPLWLIISAGAFAFVLVGGKVGLEIEKAFLSRGWSVLDTQSTPLPSNAVYDLQLGEDNLVVLATGDGVAMWTPPPPHELSGKWSLFTPQNSPLPNEQVLRELHTPRGWWFGTAAGLAFYDGKSWSVYHAADMGLRDDTIHALAQDQQGHLWVGTNNGLVELVGSQWQVFNTANSGIIADAIFALAIDNHNSSPALWIGTNNGIGQYDITRQVWKNFKSPEYPIPSSGIVDIMVDHQGWVWASSLGEGVSIWNGQNWRLLNSSNSGLPMNYIDRVVETEPGVYWLAASMSSDVGGFLVRYDLKNWVSYTSSNSGYTGGEPLAILRDKTGQLLFGTRTSGLVIFQSP